MAYDSNTKVALLVAKFSEVLLFSFSALSLSNNHVFTDLLDDYRGIEEDNYQQLINKLLDAYRLTTPNIVDFDGTLVTFETSIWQRNIKFLLDAHQRKLRIAKQSGQAKSFHAIPSSGGYDLERKY